MSLLVEQLDSANEHRFTIVIVIFAIVIFSWSYQLLNATYSSYNPLFLETPFHVNNQLLLVLLPVCGTLNTIGIHWCEHACFTNDCVGSEFTLYLFVVVSCMLV